MSVEMFVAASVDVWCDTCGVGLCNVSRFIKAEIGGFGRPGLHVEACERCIDKAHDEGAASSARELADAEKETQRVVAENENLKDQVRRANKRADAAEDRLARADLEADLALAQADLEADLKQEKKP